MRNLLLILTLAGARACTPGTDVGIKKCCPDGNESPYYNGGVGYADLPCRRHDGGVEDLSPSFPE